MQNTKSKLHVTTALETLAASTSQFIVLGFIFAAAILLPIISSSGCSTSLFPKIIGGNTGTSWANLIDIYNDDLAFCGDCFDPPLTSVSS